ncbi:MAG: MFS transporter [Proteobacteria bacterium]|nr:MFS transporter [Pseudomonadota bacterium]
MNTQAESVESKPVPWRDDALIVGLVAGAHLVSHFFQLVLAPLFPWIKAEFGWSYAELGFILSVMFAVSGIAQAAAGFVVDRYGPRATLCGGLACLAIGATLFGISHGYWGFVAGAVFAGLGNSVFHPVDFWFINHRVSVPRLGPAYSVHGLSGSLGWAFAPVFLVGLAAPFGWRAAVLGAALLPVLVIALVFLYREVLDAPATTHQASTAHAPPSTESPLAFLKLPVIWLCFGFFFFVAAALGGVQSFSPTVFMQGYGLDRHAAAMSITVYMLASAGGMLAGGWLVSRSRALERNITIALALSVLAALAVAMQLVPGTLAMVFMAVMGFGSGLSGPSRDMLIRSASPPGATGRVYGVVYSGLDAGIAAGPFVFGKMLDHGLAVEVFYGVALCLFGGVVIAWRVARETARSRAMAS